MGYKVLAFMESEYTNNLLVVLISNIKMCIRDRVDSHMILHKNQQFVLKNQAHILLFLFHNGITMPEKYPISALPIFDLIRVLYAAG